MTAVPGTNAFISTAVHGNPLFRGSAVSYDVGQTWTEIEKDASKAVCRFFDANTGYAGGFFLTGPPLRGGIYKSQVVFPGSTQPFAAQRLQSQGLEEDLPGKPITIYPTPANDVVNDSSSTSSAISRMAFTPSPIVLPAARPDCMVADLYLLK